VQHIVDAIIAGDASEADFAAFDVPDHYTAALLRKDDETMFEGMPTRERDPRKAIHIEDVPVPEIGPGEALVAVMASAINYNTVWSAIFEPVSTFSFLRRYGKLSPLTKRHDLPYHVLFLTLLVSCCGLDPASTYGNRAMRLLRTARPSSWKVRSDTTTRCSTLSNASGDSRRTSAGWRSSRWLRRTSCLRSRRT